MQNQKTPAIEISLNLVHWVIGFHISFDDKDDGMLLLGFGPLMIAIAKPRVWGWWVVLFNVGMTLG